MPLKYWLKISVLSLAFTATITSIYLLKQGHMSQFWTSLGFKSKDQVLSWCNERVRSVHFYGEKFKIHEVKQQWVSQTTEDSSDNAVLLNYLDVEKWFAKYCQVDIEKPGAVTMAGKPLLEVEFITGERITFHEIDEAHFKLQGKIYKSPTLRKAFKELLAFGPKFE